MTNPNDLDFVELYEKANRHFKICIRNEDNAFLQDQIDIRLEEIGTRDASVRVEFVGHNRKNFEIETKIWLLANDDQNIGYYSLVEDEKGNLADDFLVFD